MTMLPAQTTLVASLVFVMMGLKEMDNNAEVSSAQVQVQ